MMYFLNEEHEGNYNRLVTVVFPHAKKDSEYNSMAYVLAVPSIYKRCANDPLFPRFPFLWTVKYQDTSYQEIDEDTGEEYSVTDFEVEKDEDGNEVTSKAFGTLSHGYTKLVWLAMHLFDSNNTKFNMLQCFGTWDDNLAKVFFQALKLRMEWRKPIEGLEINIK